MQRSLDQRGTLGVSVFLGGLLCVAQACGDGATGPSSGSSGSSSSSSSSTSSSSGGASDSGAALDTGGDAQVSYPDPLAGTGAPTLVATGFQFTEGPLWLPSANKLIFSDVPADRIFELSAGSNKPTVYRDPSNHTNGHGVGPKGVFYSCEQGGGSGGRISRTLADGALDTVVSAFAGANFNAPNDIIVRADGNVYFTDPNYSGNTQPKQNVFRIAPGATAATVVDDSLSKPNGITLSPDQNTLYVASYAGDFVNKYVLAADGTPGPSSKFISNISGPDGIAVDDAGNLYAAVASGIAVYRPDGSVIGTIAVPNGKRASNIAFGEVDRKTLYITAQSDLYKVKLNVPGPP